MIRPFATATLIVLATTTPSHADGRVSFVADAGEAGRMTMTERWTDSAMRTDIDGMDAYMIMRDATVYSIISMSGQITVMDLGQIPEMPGAGAGQTPPQQQTGVVFPDTIESVEELDETREIAGIEGDVYEIEWVGNDGQTQTDTAVLTDAPRLLEHQTLKMRFIEAITGEAPNSLLVDLDARGLAALSFGDRFRVTAVGGDPGPAGDFRLPAAPMDLDNMMNPGLQ